MTQPRNRDDAAARYAHAMDELFDVLVWTRNALETTDGDKSLTSAGLVVMRLRPQFTSWEAIAQLAALAVVELAAQQLAAQREAGS